MQERQNQKYGGEKDEGRKGAVGVEKPILTIAAATLPSLLLVL